MITKALAKGLLLAVSLWLGCSAAAPVRPNDTDVVIGVLAYRGHQNAIRRWQPTADYLSHAIPRHHFVVRALTLHGMQQATARGELDFVLTNPGDYVDLESRYGISRLVTLRNLRDGNAYTEFGAVIFTRADRKDIQNLRDLKGKSFMAVSKQAFGGFQLAWLELLRHGVNPFKDFSRLEFHGFPQDDIVLAVRDGKVDAGTVRTDILERMAAASKIDISQFRILDPRTTPDFPFRHTTALYPEWPFAKTIHTPDNLAQRVAVALLTMNRDDPAARAGHYAGWTVPLDYHKVRDLFRELRIGPYAQPMDLGVLVQRYWHWLLGAALLITLMAATTVYVLNLNRQLKYSALSLERAFNERRRAAAEMQKLSRALEQTADLVLITDRHGVIEYVNPTFEQITGYARDEAIGQTPRLLKSGIQSEKFYGELWTSIRSGQSFTAVFTNRRKDGSLYYEEKTITPIKDEHGEVQHFVSTGKDITDRVLTEQRARQHEAQLAHVARVSTMGEMASALAHELNQPLAAIVNYARGSIRRLDGGKTEPVQLSDALRRIAEQGERSGEIIRRLRAFMRKSELRRASTEINDVVREAVDLASLEARHRHVQLRLQLADGLPLLMADGIQIEQVVLNLVRNAMEAMHSVSSATREVVIRTALRADGYLEVSVADTGPGLQTDETDGLFEAFYTTKEDGMGMGLSISRSIIEAHGGRLSANNRPQGGAIFTFTLPPLSHERAGSGD